MFPSHDLHRKEFEIDDSDLEDVEIIYAQYETGCYEGSCVVLFKKEGKLFLIEASHCSCYGLEDQWDAVEITEKSLKKEIDARKFYLLDESQEFINFCYDYFKWARDEEVC